MITMVDVNGMDAPRILCDQCGEAITKSGNVQWKPGAPELYFTHKECCHRFEAARGGEWYATEMDAWLYNLVHNARIDWKKAKQTSAMLAGI